MNIISIIDITSNSWKQPRWGTLLSDCLTRKRGMSEPVGLSVSSPKVETHRMAKNGVEAYVSSGNVFVDLGLPSADRPLAKAKLTTDILTLIRRQRLSYTRALRWSGSRRKPVARSPSRLRSFLGPTSDEFSDAARDQTTTAAHAREPVDGSVACDTHCT
jgi:hypothetical protein